jgi:hypothetical protein
MAEMGRMVGQPGRGVELIGRESLSRARTPVRAFGFGRTTASGATETGGEFKLTLRRSVTKRVKAITRRVLDEEREVPVRLHFGFLCVRDAVHSRG